MNLGLKTKRFLVTGASQGIGKAIAYRFLAEGASVAITARGKKNLYATAKEFQNQFERGKILHFSVDCISESDLAALKQKLQHFVYEI